MITYAHFHFDSSLPELSVQGLRICRGFLRLAPLHFRVASFSIGGISFWAPCISGLSLFSLEVFLFEPLAFCRCLFFHRMSFFWAPCILVLSLFSSKVFLFSPLHFGVASFFIGCLSFCAPCILGLPLFHQRCFFWAPCVLGLPLFSSDVFLFEPTNEGCNNAPFSWLWLTWHNNFCWIRS
jgi:hypothetical protein